MPNETASKAPSIRIDLDYPITDAGVTLDHLDLRRPTMRDMIHAEKQGGGEVAQEVSRVASLTGVSPAAIESLDLADFMKVQEAAQNFLR